MLQVCPQAADVVEVFMYLSEPSHVCQLLLTVAHENMSTRMVDYIVDEHNIDIESEASRKRRHEDMIVASCDHASPNNLKEKCFLYDIVANGRNRFDYIVHESRACGLGCNFQTSLPYVIVPGV
ncbi:hypothetical protein Dimus_010400 [Dionaea muscipula]